jgi:hypothetical protein
MSTQPKDFKIYDTILDCDPANPDPFTNPVQTSPTSPFPVDPLGQPVFVIRRTIKKNTRVIDENPI